MTWRFQRALIFFFSFKTFQPCETADRALEVSLDVDVDSSWIDAPRLEMSRERSKRSESGLNHTQGPVLEESGLVMPCTFLSPFLPGYWYDHWWGWLHFSLPLMLMGSLFVSCFLDYLFRTLVVWLVDVAETTWDGQVIRQWEASCPVCTACLCGHKGQRWLSQIAMVWLLGAWSTLLLILYSVLSITYVVT